jgi:antirestriction protein ArdC
MTRRAGWKGVTTMTKQTTKQDRHNGVTGRTLAELQQGTCLWQKPWSGGDMAPSGRTWPLRATGQPYCGINVSLL